MATAPAGPVGGGRMGQALSLTQSLLDAEFLAAARPSVLAAPGSATRRLRTEPALTVNQRDQRSLYIWHEKSS